MVLVRPYSMGLMLLGAVLFLVVMHGVVTVCYLDYVCVAPPQFVYDFGYLFDMNKELNVPSWFSSSLLLASGLLLLLVGLNARRSGLPGLPWVLMTVLFFYMSMDESTDLHGFWGRVVDAEALMGKGKAGFAWVLPGAVVVAAVGLVALRWALSLPEQTRNAFIIAGIVYVAGGLGFELIGSQVADETFLNPAYLLASGLEETLEMCGVVIMLVGVVMHLQAMDWVMDRGRPDAAEDDPVMYDPVTADS
jgi:hypothetical protein